MEMFPLNWTKMERDGIRPVNGSAHYQFNENDAVYCTLSRPAPAEPIRCVHFGEKIMSSAIYPLLYQVDFLRDLQFV